MANYCIGLDLGQSRDYSALIVAERVLLPDHTPPERAFADDIADPVDEYHVRHIQRWQLGTPYDVVVEQVAELLQEPELRKALLVADRTGVGGAVFDLFRSAYGEGRLGDVWPRGVTLTAGFSRGPVSAASEGHGWTTAHKGDVIARLLVLFERGLVKLPPGLPQSDVLVRELRAFKLKQNERTGHVSYEAARESDHDDLVIALALSVWFRHNYASPRFVNARGELREM